MHLPIFFNLALLICTHLCTGTAFAGSPSRPYLVWANLDEINNPDVTTIIRGYVNSLPGDEFCNDSAFGWIIYMHSRPTGLPNNLIRDALGHNKAAVRSIAKNLRSFRDKDINDGLDGIIAYKENGRPRMTSIDARGIIISSAVKNPKDPNQIINAFCSVIPEIYRK